MNDKNLMEDILVTLKGVCDLYMHATVESSTPIVHTTFQNVLFEILELQNETYTLMSQNGWYQTQNVPQNKIEQTKQQALQA